MDYTHCFKYPSTPVLPNSPGSRGNDEFDTSLFEGKEVVILEKLDGENANLLRDHYYARSIDGRHHPSRDWLKAFHATFKHDIPEGWRFSGENMFAFHSIYYVNLESYFYLFAIWNEKNESLSWDSVLEWAELLGLVTPKQFYRGVWDEEIVRNIKFNPKDCEGYVVRTVEGFAFNEFTQHIAKYVRENHVNTSEHWMFQDIKMNKLRSK